MKRNKGITLIALVITIIVLLILAGVAISMLSGENGILRKAAEAKTKTEEAQKEETTTLTDMELDSHFITNNLTYKCKYGFITGIKAGKAAEELKNVLNSQGYILRNIDNTEDVADETPLTTGMAVIKKDANSEEIVARTVIFGDTNCDGYINLSDNSPIIKHSNNISAKIYERVAMDINQDEIIDSNDSTLITNMAGGGERIEQNRYALNPKKIIGLSQKITKEYIEDTLPENCKYNLEYNYEDGIYYLTGVSSKTKVSEVTSVLPNITKITTGRNTLGSEDNLVDGYYVYISTDKYGVTESVLAKIKF